jgi:2-phosphoglycerate kinase
MNRIILITGAPAVGKSTISKLVAENYPGISYIGTDLIREILRAYITPEVNPDLHTKAILASQASLEKGGSPIQGFINQANSLKDAINAILKRAIREDTSIIFEGIHLFPGGIDLDEIKDFHLTHIVLKVASEEQHLTQMNLQGSVRNQGKLENLPLARKFQEYLIELSSKYNSITVENEFNKQAETAKKIM